METHMIIDHEQELCTSGGQLFNATDGNAEYGAKCFDLKAASPGDPAVGEPLEFWAKVGTANCDVGTSYDIELVNDDDGAGTNEISLVKRTILLAALTANTKHPIGRVMPGLCTRRYLTAKVTTHGTTPTAGLLTLWVQKASDGSPLNAAS